MNSVFNFLRLQKLKFKDFTLLKKVWRFEGVKEVWQIVWEYLTKCFNGINIWDDQWNSRREERARKWELILQSDEEAKYRQKERGKKF